MKTLKKRERASCGARLYPSTFVKVRALALKEGRNTPEIIRRAIEAYERLPDYA